MAIKTRLLVAVEDSLRQFAEDNNMQRQSIGSPGSKVQSHVGKEQKLEGEEKRKEGEEDEEEIKDDKILRPTFLTKNSIHLIPLLIIFCFLILYLVSYDPSQKDLLNIGAFEPLSRPKDSMEIRDFERFFEMEKREVFAIRSHRSLQEVEKETRRSSLFNLHRKFAVPHTRTAFARV